MNLEDEVKYNIEKRFINKLKKEQIEFIFKMIDQARADERKKVLEEIKNGKICTNCGGKKDTRLSDWCLKCLEEE